MSGRFKHVTGFSPKAAPYAGLRVATESSATLLAATDRFFAAPWSASGDGRLFVWPLANAGRIPAQPPLILAHRENLTDFAWSPVTCGDDDVVATCSRDGTAKIWRVPATGLSAPLTEPLATLPHGRRVVALAYHPHAAGVLATVAADATVRVWDAAAATEAVPRAATVAHPDAVLCCAWDEDEGRFFLSTCKDLHMRLFDPRAGADAVAAARAADVAKGFRARFLEGRPSLLLSVGFSKGGARQAVFWDSRKLAEPAHVVAIDDQPAPLMPFFDPGTGLLFLGGRGATFPFLETLGHAPYVAHVGKHSTASTRTAVAMLPKRVCDVMRCEVARFLCLTGNGSAIEQLSFYVPRRDYSVFHEDLFPPAPSGAPSTDATAWFSSRDASKAVVVSLQPEGTVSVYSVPIEEGGKSRQKDEEERMDSLASDAKKPVAKISQGKIKMLSEGWLYNAFVDRFASIAQGRLFVFENDEAATSLLSIPALDIVSVSSNEEAQTDFFVETATKVFSFRATDNSTRDSWVRSVEKMMHLARRAIESSDPTPQASSAEASLAPSPAVASGTTTPVPANVVWDIEGKLVEHSPGIFRSARKKLFTVQSGIMYSQALAWWTEEPNGNPVEVLHLDRVLSVSKTEGVFDPKLAGFSFEVATATVVFHFLAATEEDRSRWMEALERFRRAPSALSLTPSTGRSPREGDAAAAAVAEDEYLDDEDEQEEEVRFDGNVSLFWGIGVLGYWTPCYVSVVADEVFFFKTKTASTPFFRVPLSRVLSFTITETHDPNFHDTDFQAQLSDGSVLYFRSRDLRDRTRMMHGLENKRKRAVDVLESLDIVEATAGDDPLLQDATGVVEWTSVEHGKHKLLLHVMGKRKIRAWNAELSASALNPHNSFLLDAGIKLFVWNGKKASRVGKAKAMDLAQRIRKERGARPEVIVLDQGADGGSPEFWQALGSGAAAVRSTEECASPAEQDLFEFTITVYRIGRRQPEARPKAKKRVSVVHQATDAQLPSKKLLCTKNVYVIDAGSEIYVWVGKNSDMEQRKLGMLVARKLRASSVRVAWAFVARVLQGSEPVLMKEKFSGFKGSLPIHTGTIEAAGRVATARAQKGISEIVQGMHREFVPHGERLILDDGSGELRVWRIEEFGMVDYPHEMYGHFFAGESFVMDYKYVLNNKEAHVIYFWQGRDSSISDKGTSAYLTAEQSVDLGGSMSVQVRVVQHKETEHFLKVFKHLGYIVHAGKFSGFAPATRYSLYDVRGSSALWCKTVEAERKPASLSSLHAFVLRTPARVWRWEGALSIEDERTTALHAAERMAAQNQGCSVERVLEGSEPEEFWAALGSPAPQDSRAYSALKAPLPVPRTAHCPRLFACSQASGAVEIEEEGSPCQDDLVERGVFILDAFYCVWVWIGTRATPPEKRTALEAALRYSKDASSTAVPVLAVQPHREPTSFKVLFHAWSSATKLRRPKGDAGGGSGGEMPPVPAAELLREYTKQVYSFSELLSDPLPEGVDPTHLEKYLSDTEFVEVFKMTPAEFAALKKWNQEQLKREVGLY